MIRVLHVFNSLNRGGAETVIMNYYRKINKTKVQFDFAVHIKGGNYEKEVREMGGNIYYIPKFCGYNILSYCYEWSVLLYNHPEIQIIQGHMPSTACIYLLIGKLFGKYAIANSHTNDVNNEDGYIKRKIRKLLYFCTRYVANKFYGCSREAGIANFGEKIVDSKKFSIWTNAIDFSKFKYSKEIRDKIRNELRLEKDDIVIGHVGRFTWAKNHKFIIKLIKKLYEHNKKIKLLLLGDGELKKEIIKLVEKEDIQDAVIFAGNVDNVNEYMSSMDLFILPSIYEGLPTVTIEAQVNGLMCIVGEKITREIIITNIKKILFISIDKVDEWVNAIEAIVNKEIGREVGDLNEEYNVNYVVKKMPSVYSGFLK